MDHVEKYFLALSDMKFEDHHLKKLLLSLKFYMARACSTVRDPRIIQVNHYIDEYFVADRNNFKNIILSPSTAPLPMAYFVNFSLIKNDSSKFFFINCKKEIETHPFEYIIPVFVALFSGRDSAMKYKPTGQVFLSCVVLTGEIAMELIKSKMLTVDYSIFVAVVVSISIVWKLSIDTVTYVTDCVLKEKHINLQTCLQYVTMATCSPGWFTTHHVPQHETSKILSFINEEMRLPIKNFTVLDVLRLSLLDMDPIGTLLAGSAYNQNAERLKINIPKRFIESTGDIEIGMITKRLQCQLSRFIAWNGSDNDPNSSMLLYDSGEEVPNAVDIDLVDENNEDVPFLTIYHQNKKHVVVEFSQMKSDAANFDPLLISKMKWNLHVVIGLQATEIVFDNIDALINQNSMAETLKMMFTRPGLD